MGEISHAASLARIAPCRSTPSPRSTPESAFRSGDSRFRAANGVCANPERMSQALCSGSEPDGGRSRPLPIDDDRLLIYDPIVRRSANNRLLIYDLIVRRRATKPLACARPGDSRVTG
jgi:hypothetical protein